jgi:hypothetical protein
MAFARVRLVPEGILDHQNRATYEARRIRGRAPSRIGTFGGAWVTVYWPKRPASPGVWRCGTRWEWMLTEEATVSLGIPLPPRFVCEHQIEPGGGH